MALLRHAQWESLFGGRGSFRARRSGLTVVVLGRLILTLLSLAHTSLWTLIRTSLTTFGGGSLATYATRPIPLCSPPHLSLLYRHLCKCSNTLHASAFLELHIHAFLMKHLNDNGDISARPRLEGSYRGRSWDPRDDAICPGAVSGVSSSPHMVSNFPDMAVRAVSGRGLCLCCRVASRVFAARPGPREDGYALSARPVTSVAILLPDRHHDQRNVFASSVRAP